MRLPFIPFKADSSFSIDNLKFENVDEKVVISGNLEIPFSKEGKAKSEILHDAVNVTSVLILYNLEGYPDIDLDFEIKDIPFNPFADDSSAFSIGEMTIENGTKKIAIIGSIEVPKSREGVETIIHFQEIVNRIMDKMISSDLPDVAEEEIEEGGEVDNPFM
jgi:hypothetical protein